MSVPINYARLQNKLAYQFKQLEKLQLALTHRSAAQQHNERMEFLGDAVLGAVISEQLYKKFPQADEGQLSRLRSFLVKEKALFELAQSFDLGDYLNLGSGELKSGGFTRRSILADAFEAIIAAIYLDAGFENTKTFILNIYQDKLSSLSLDMAKKDAKTRLQEWLQGENLQIPVYQVIAEEGKDHAKTYTVSCQIEYQSITTQGQAKSRRKAEQEAASKALEQIENSR